MHFQLQFIVFTSVAMGAFALLQPGEPCTSASQCEFGQYTGTRFCCATPLGGTYCSECCSDANCPTKGGKPMQICVAGYPLYTDQKHVRYCSEGYVYPAGQPCFRNDMCISGKCTGAFGQCGDYAHLPYGKCA